MKGRVKQSTGVAARYRRPQPLPRRPDERWAFRGFYEFTSTALAMPEFKTRRLLYVEVAIFVVLLDLITLQEYAAMTMDCGTLNHGFGFLKHADTASLQQPSYHEFRFAEPPVLLRTAAQDGEVCSTIELPWATKDPAGYIREKVVNGMGFTLVRKDTSLLSEFVERPSKKVIEPWDSNMGYTVESIPG
ncbi:hypothetical protein ACJZ2D_001902 [Fusarium nematophilum]